MTTIDCQTGEKITRPNASDQKQAAIIEAAQDTFLEHGFDGASMDAIALKANVSKRTVYNRFRSKEELFGAAIEDICRRVLPFNPDEIESSLNPKAYVRELSFGFLRTVLSPEAISLRRIATFESARKPSLGAAYLEHGLYFLIKNTAPLVQRLADRGVLKIGDPHTAICQLGALITEPLFSEVLLGVKPENLEEAITNQVTTGLDAFWRLYGVEEHQ